MLFVLAIDFMIGCPCDILRMTARETINTKCGEIQAEIDRMDSDLRAFTARCLGFEEAITMLKDEDRSGFLRKKLEDKIRKEKMAIEGAKDMISDAYARLSAFEETQKMLSKEGEDQAPELRPGSELFKVREAIKKHGHPMNLSEMLKVLGKTETSETKNSLRGSIGRYARTDTIFTKISPNTFGLMELGHKTKTIDLQLEDEPKTQ
jgi:hypothetical protein